MKKILFSAALLLSAMTMNAQTADSLQTNNSAKAESNEYKVDPGKFMMEVGFSPLSSDGVSLLGGQLRGIYVVSERIELKLGLGYHINKSSNDSGDNIESKYRTSSLSIAPGFNYTFEGTNRLEPYIGAEIAYATTASKQKSETSTTKITQKNTDQTRYNTFAIAAQTGFNFFVAKNLFVGVELGIGLDIYVAKGSYEETEIQGKNEKTETEGESNIVSFAPAITPNLRLGWAF